MSRSCCRFCCCLRPRVKAPSNYLSCSSCSGHFVNLHTFGVHFWFKSGLRPDRAFLLLLLSSLLLLLMLWLLLSFFTHERTVRICLILISELILQISPFNVSVSASADDNNDNDFLQRSDVVANISKVSYFAFEFVLKVTVQK